MRLLFVFLLCVNLLACGSKLPENPDSAAQTYTEKEFNDDTKALFKSPVSDKTPMKLQIDYISIMYEKNGYSVTVPEKLKTDEQVQAYGAAILKEIESIDQYLKKYEGNFRVRYADGDLKIMALTEFGLKNAKDLREAWMNALKNLENDYGFEASLSVRTDS